MTEGFDAATPQAGINMAAAKDAGREFVFVKAAGGNVGLYVAPHYADELDTARAVGLHVGHTFLTGRAASPAASARYFVQNLRHFNVARDALALDNERFPDEPGSQMWNDAQVAEFWTEVFTLLPALLPRKAFTYGDQAHLTALAPWTRTNGLGCSWWVANYHSNDGSRGSLPVVPGVKVTIHQYASTGTLGGRTVDLDWSAETVAALFEVPLPAPVHAPAPAPAPAPVPVLAAVAIPEEEPMPIYFKGDQKPAVYVLNPYTGTKRYVSEVEYEIAVKGTGAKVIQIAQSHADVIPHV